jgi:hypothetical protein
MEPNPPTPTPFHLSHATALPIMRAALLLHADLLPSWQKPDENTADFGACMLFNGAPENILFSLGREFARALVPFLEDAKAYELAAGMQSAIQLGSCLTDDLGLRGVYLDHMNTDIQGGVFPVKPGPAEQSQ